VLLNMARFCGSVSCEEVGTAALEVTEVDTELLVLVVLAVVLEVDADA